MIDLIPFEAGHMLTIIQEGVIECGIRAAANDFVRETALHREGEGRSMTGIEDGKVLGCYGVDLLWPGVAEFWAMFSPDIEKRSIEVCRLIKSEVDRLAEDYHRVQSHVRFDFWSALRMMQWLGFREECLCRKFTQDGADCYQFARIK